MVSSAPPIPHLCKHVPSYVNLGIRYSCHSARTTKILSHNSRPQGRELSPDPPPRPNMKQESSATDNKVRPARCRCRYRQRHTLPGGQHCDLRYSRLNRMKKKPATWSMRMSCRVWDRLWRDSVFIQFDVCWTVHHCENWRMKTN